MRRTLRRLGQSAPGLAVVPAAVLPEGDAEPQIAERDDRPARERDVGAGEVLDRPHGRAAAVGAHIRTIAPMSEDARRVRTRHGELTLEEIAELLPDTGELMQSVGNTWWKCAYAARGGNWGLAAYFVRRTRGLLRKLGVVRPKYAGDVASFEHDHIGPVLAACEASALDAFEPAYTAAVEAANALHAKWGKSYVRWTLPKVPPTDLELTPE